MSPPLCRFCRQQMRVLGLQVVPDGGRDRVFQVWACFRAGCKKGQACTEAGTVDQNGDEWERKREE